MKALLRVLLLLLTVGVWSQVCPSAPLDGSDSSSGRDLGGLSDCQGLPGAPGTPEVRRTLVDPSARSVREPQKPIDWLGGGAGAAKLGAKPSGALLLDCPSTVAAAFQQHLRTNGSADAHGSRA